MSIVSESIISSSYIINIDNSSISSNDKDNISSPSSLSSSSINSIKSIDLYISNTNELKLNSDKLTIHIPESEINKPEIEIKKDKNDKLREEYHPAFCIDKLFTDDERFNQIVIQVAYNRDNIKLTEDEVLLEATILFNKSKINSEGRIILSEKAIQILEESTKLEVEIEETYSFCDICAESKPSSEFITLENCNHRYCSSCLKHYIDTKIANSDNIYCPDCVTQFSMEEFIIVVYKINDPPILEKYQRYKYNREVSKNPNAKWCPRPDCNTFTIGYKESPKLICTKCSTIFCFNCNQNWHEGACEDYLDSQYKEWKKSNDVQNCPACNVQIQKVLGCNHMTCAYCKHEFCWLCRGLYTPNHFELTNPSGCPGMQFTFEETDSYFRPGEYLIWILRFFAFLFAGIIGAIIFIPWCIYEYRYNIIIIIFDFFSKVKDCFLELIVIISKYCIIIHK